MPPGGEFRIPPRKGEQRGDPRSDLVVADPPAMSRRASIGAKAKPATRGSWPASAITVLKASEELRGWS
jgi:hypothetical protein